MTFEQLARNDWIRAATLAQMVLSQALPDERVDELVAPPADESIRTVRAA